jgi:L-ascorbate metabolism protein UlaG (beta-lactamase superfamily)
VIKPVLQDDAFLADVAATREDRSDTLRLWWLGQSGFLLQCHRRHVLFDPYLSDSLTKKYANTDKPHVRMTERVVAPEKLDFLDVITSTHNHTDHFDPETLLPIAQATIDRLVEMGHSKEVAAGMLPHLIVPWANLETAWRRLGIDWDFMCPLNAWEKREVAKMVIRAVPAAHDQLAADEEGNNLYLGYVFRYPGWTVYHSGDTVVYDGMVDELRAMAPIDVAILPINGKLGNMSGRDAARLANDINAKLVIPCHYQMFEFNTADPRDEFIPECERLGQPYKVLRAGERLTLPM